MRSRLVGVGGLVLLLALSAPPARADALSGTAPRTDRSQRAAEASPPPAGSRWVSRVRRRGWAALQELRRLRRSWTSELSEFPQRPQPNAPGGGSRTSSTAATRPTPASATGGTPVVRIPTLKNVVTLARNLQRRVEPHDALALLALLLAGLLLARRMRGRGDLVVAIDYPPDRRGSFRVHVTNRPERPSRADRASTRRRRAPRAPSSPSTVAPTATKTERFLVTRETSFSKLRAGRVWVVVDGELRDASEGRPEHCFAQRPIRLVRGRTVRVDFSFPLPKDRARAGAKQTLAPAEAPVATSTALLPSERRDDGAALARLDETLAGDALEGAALGVLERYARLLVGAERFEEALAVLEVVRRREPGRAHVATWVDELRKRVTVGRAVTAALREPGGDAALFSAAGRYEILAEIGRGGMGVVYRAHDKRLDRVVALKRLPESLRDHPRAVELVLREARSAARLNHPHIVTVYDVDQEDGVCFLTMEYLEGQPLNALLRQRGRVTPRTAAWLARQAASGLAYAHERGIVHRDVKTANLFLTRERTLKIMDFGLAKLVEEVRRHVTLIAWTPGYVAPEQSLGLPVDGRADLYSLGVTLFELLTGSVPFRSGDVARHHRETNPPDPRELISGLPDSLVELTLELLAKRPEERPASAGDVAARLSEIERAIGGAD